MRIGSRSKSRRAGVLLHCLLLGAGTVGALVVPAVQARPASGEEQARAATAPGAQHRPRRHLGAAAPTPTPTPTPTEPPSTTLTRTDLANGFFLAFGKVGGSSPTFESMLSTVLTTGIPALIDIAVNARPATRSVIPNGVRLNYGAGVVTNKGTFQGIMDVTHSDVVIDGNRVDGSYEIGTAGFAMNGKPLPFDYISGRFQTELTSASSVEGLVTVSGYNLDTRDNVNGKAIFDTAECAKYPIGGGATFVVGGKVRTVAFNRRCDGTWDDSGDLRYGSFQEHYSGCSGGGGEPTIYLMARDGQLYLDSSCPASYTDDHTITGTVTPSDVTLNFETRDRALTVVTGTFSGHDSNPSPIWGGANYRGTLTYTLTERNPDGTVKCTKSGSSEEVLLLYSFPVSYCFVL
jgi:hypothetical protein